MRARIQELRGILLRKVKYRVTRGGMLFFLGILVVAAASAASANNLLFLILAAMLSTLLVSGFISRLCLAGLELEFLLPEHVSAGRSVSARLRIRNSKFWMPSFSIHVIGVESGTPPVLTSPIYFPVIPGGASIDETVYVRFSHRGAHSQNSFAFTTRFPFGFLEKTVRVTLRREVIVYPSLEPQPGFEELLAGIAGEIETHYRGLGRDFYRIRPYEAFESARHVDWKATAHTGQLQVREFSRDQEQAVEIFLDQNLPPEATAWFESAVNCCAFLSWRLSERGIGVHFRTQEFDRRVPQDCDVYTILKYLALVAPQRGKLPLYPVDQTSYQIVFSMNPEQFQESNWSSARLLGPASLDVPPISSGGNFR